MKGKLLIPLFTSFLMFTQSVSAEKIVLAGGCFWCMEADFEKLDGVTNVVAGFTGGQVENPTYNGNHQGHYEAVEITYSEDEISYQELLDYYWINIDPFDDKGQFCDKGESYLAAIFVADQEQREIAEQSKQQVMDNFPNQTVVTEILPAATFYPIKGTEDYHQNYYITNPIRYNVYRWNCGRDKRLKEIWGKLAKHK